MIKFGRFPDRTVPNIGAEAALMALTMPATIKDMQAICGKPWSSKCGRSKNSSRESNRYPSSKLCKRINRC